MKKTLVAIAALAAVTAATAQSSVTLYGRLNMGTSGNTTETKDNAGVKTGEVKSLSLAGAEGINTTQRFGVRGSEDIGGGMKINFNVETKVNSDSNVGTFGNTRNAFVQAAGGFGAVTIGTYLNALDGIGAYAAGAFSVAGGDILARVAGAGGATGLGLPTRSTNAVAYTTPTFSGMSGFIGTSNEKTETDAIAAGVTTTTTTQTDGYMLGLRYNNGPLAGSLVYGRGNMEAAAGGGTDAKATDWGITAQMDLGPVVPYAAYRASKTTGMLAGTAGVNNTGKVYEIGASFPMGAFKPYITYAAGDIKTSAAGVVGRDDTLKGFQIGAYYDLSKRTYLMVSLGQDTMDSNISGNLSEVKSRGYALGIVHNF